MNARNDRLAQLTDEFEAQLLEAYPSEAIWMLQMHPVRALWGGGFDLLGETYPTAESAIEAQRTLIMFQLMQIGAAQ